MISHHRRNMLLIALLTTLAGVASLISALEVNELKSFHFSKAIMETRHREPLPGCVLFGVNLLQYLGESEVSIHTSQIEGLVSALIEKLKVPGNLNTSEMNDRFVQRLDAILNNCYDILSHHHRQALDQEPESTQPTTIQPNNRSKMVPSQRTQDLVNQLEEQQHIAREIKKPKFGVPLPGMTDESAPVNQRPSPRVTTRKLTPTPRANLAARFVDHDKVESEFNENGGSYDYQEQDFKDSLIAEEPRMPMGGRIDFQVS